MRLKDPSRSSDPRDLLEIVQSICRFRKQEVRLTAQLMEDAANRFFCQLEWPIRAARHKPDFCSPASQSTDSVDSNSQGHPATSFPQFLNADATARRSPRSLHRLPARIPPRRWNLAIATTLKHGLTGLACLCVAFSGCAAPGMSGSSPLNGSPFAGYRGS